MHHHCYMAYNYQQNDIFYSDLSFISLVSLSVLKSVIQPIILMVLKPRFIIYVPRVNPVSIFDTVRIL